VKKRVKRKLELESEEKGWERSDGIMMRRVRISDD